MGGYRVAGTLKDVFAAIEVSISAVSFLGRSGFYCVFSVIDDLRRCTYAAL